MHCLRALPSYLASELSEEFDLVHAPPRELLAPLPRVPEECNNRGACLCRHAFVGMASGAVSTLAYVGIEDDD